MAISCFLNNAKISTIIPYEPEIDFESALSLSVQHGSEDGAWPFSNIQQRNLLFFDELVTTYIVLQLVDCEEAALKSQIQNIALQLDVYALTVAESKPEAENASASPKEVIFSSSIRDIDDPLVIVNAVGDDEGTRNHIYVIWKSEAYLNRPRARIQHPSVIFSASATIGPVKRLQRAVEDEYLPSLTPASANVFQPLIGFEAQNTAPPYLPASRLLRVAPAAKTEEPSFDISQSAPVPIRIIPAASARVRYARTNTYSTQPAVIASLDFEVTPLMNLELNLESVEISLLHGTVEDFSSSSDVKLPIFCRARDDLTFIYKLVAGQAGHYSTLDISIKAVVLLSKTCQPEVSMRWKTSIDFSIPLNPTFGGASQALQRNNRPSSLSMTMNSTGTSFSGAPPRRSPISPRECGLTVTFSAPLYVEVGQPFDWCAFIVNKSDKMRHFAITVMPKDPRPSESPSPQSPSSINTSIAAGNVAEAVVDESDIFIMTQKAVPHETKLLFLSSEVISR
ncbi:hypothetical protein LOZ61_002665 [Ophidiomyces ophidiicola]|nr:hypothetical protein LOZ61_002665 [Ophidiomyces ophidiicola]KAI1930249.1 hypothetical protein LOZ60_001032 [Ophidiomyces ophidiicola]KAI1967686.1 hypothetical protein LOZ56_005391 [Ophidiomyces ophidiicola]KAI1968140.1 hypothetical protein LOZ59_000501 [Ophidiomyces ophidiicola]KAI2006800.1 hypothetical protein LOZ49_004873 [Ophidiomyces ophidiicola]